MRRELRWLAAASLAMLAAAYGTEAYVRAAMPLYRWGAEWLIQSRPWQIDSLSIENSKGSDRRELLMRSEVRAHSWDAEAAATVETRLQLAAVTQNAVVFWLLLMLVPAASLRRRLALLALGVPVFIVLEVATTGCQLVNPIVQAAAMLEGEADPLTWSERWSRLLESGGRVVMEVSAALFCLSLLALLERRRATSLRQGLPA